ncbi:MAG TPA: hypothetical protein VKE22_23615 [Haliangiales bacterium]|nr:hypothetical protein [Haliangiales bacterium]
MILVWLMACTHNPVPDERILDAEQVPTWTRGLWVVVEPFSGNPVEGELVEASGQGVTVLIGQSLVRFRPPDCQRVTVAVFRTRESVPVIWTIAGTLSTLSHGGFLLISAPVWQIVGNTTVVLMHNRPIHQYPDDPLQDFARFARFPQGMPADFTPP